MHTPVIPTQCGSKPGKVTPKSFFISSRGLKQGSSPRGWLGRVQAAQAASAEPVALWALQEIPTRMSPPTLWGLELASRHRQAGNKLGAASCQGEHLQALALRSQVRLGFAAHPSRTERNRLFSFYGPSPHPGSKGEPHHSVHVLLKNSKVGQSSRNHLWLQLCRPLNSH